LSIVKAITSRPSAVVWVTATVYGPVVRSGVVVSLAAAVVVARYTLIALDPCPLTGIGFAAFRYEKTAAPLDVKLTFSGFEAV
jgi:hypothetical protein